jgi:tetraacyldisaccharide 4'-kinase
MPSFDGPVLRAQLIPNMPEVFAGRSVLAFAGIGRPEKFFRSLWLIGAKVIATQGFSDHHRYSVPELMALKTAAETAGALLVTTEKDFVRIDSNNRKGILPLPVHAVLDDVAKLDRLLDSLAAARA